MIYDESISFNSTNQFQLNLEIIFGPTLTFSSLAFMRPKYQRFFTAQLGTPESYLSNFSLGFKGLIFVAEDDTTHAQNGIIFEQTAEVAGVFAQHPEQELVFITEATFVRIYGRNVLHTLNLSQIATFTYRPAKNTIVFSHIVSVLKSKITPASNTLSFTQNAIKASGSLSNLFPINTTNFNHTVTKARLAFKTTDNALVLSSIATRGDKRSGSDDLVLVDLLDIMRVRNRLAEDELVLDQTAEYNVIYQREANNLLEIKNGYYRSFTAIPGLEIDIPGAIGVVPKRLVQLRTNNALIILPRPKLADTQKLSGTIVFKRSIVNNLYVHVRDNEIYRLKYDFTIDYLKAKELRVFLTNNWAALIDMLNWKAENWKVKVANNPLEFIYRSRAMEAHERIEVTLEFEGIKVT